MLQFFIKKDLSFNVSRLPSLTCEFLNRIRGLTSAIIDCGKFELFHFTLHPSPYSQRGLIDALIISLWLWQLCPGPKSCLWWPGLASLCHFMLDWFALEYLTFQLGPQNFPVSHGQQSVPAPRLIVWKSINVSVCSNVTDVIWRQYEGNLHPPSGCITLGLSVL